MSSTTRIVLVEDDPTLLTLYQLALQHSGLEVLTARSSAEALVVLDQCVKDKKIPKVILLDILIPAQTDSNVNYDLRAGFTVLEHVRATAILKNVPVLVMTNLDSSNDRKRATQLGTQGYIVKSNIVPKAIVEQITPYL